MGFSSEAVDADVGCTMLAFVLVYENFKKFIFKKIIPLTIFFWRLIVNWHLA